MTKYVVSGFLGAADGFRPEPTNGTVSASLDLLNKDGEPRFGMHEALRQLSRFELAPTPIGVDLLYLAAHVHAADTRLNRIRTSQDSWTREIGIVVPVSDVGVWEAAIEVLERMLRFLTGDIWTVRFRSLPESGRPGIVRQVRDRSARSFDGVSLFSGGLDSLIGAIDALSAGRSPLFVSHGGEGAVSKPQELLFCSLASGRFHNLAPARLRLGMGFPSNLFEGIGGENSTRGRSFLFLATAAFAGSSFGHPFDLRVPENGLISLNVPLDPTRLGSNSTRTTHPFYIHRWNEFLSLIGIPGKVVNPYWNRTKGEMVAECADPATLKVLAPHSLSCAHPSAKRWKEGDEPHCGYCLPCVIRRAALLKAPWEGPDETGYSVPDLRVEPLDTNRAKGRQVRGFQYAISALRERPSLAQTWIYKPGSLKEDTAIVPDLVGVYERGMEEVAAILDGVTAGPLDHAGG